MATAALPQGEMMIKLTTSASLGLVLAASGLPIAFAADDAQDGKKYIE